MKEYKYTINGTKYEVAVGNIEDNIVTVTVNAQNHLHQSLLPLPQTLTRTMPSKRHYLVLSQTSK